MKRLYSFLIEVLLPLSLSYGWTVFGENQTKTSGGDKLRSSNWGDYIDPELLEQFTKRNGSSNQYDTFDSNESNVH